MKSDITAVIPTIPIRASLLSKAVLSVGKQVLPAAALSIAVDTDHEGAPATRLRALSAVRTEWTGFLDDDDVWYPQHLLHLRQFAAEQDADYVFSYWDLSRSMDVFAEFDPLTGRMVKPGHFGQPFDPANPHHTTMTILVRTELACTVGFTPRPEGDIASGEDWRFMLGCVAAGAKIVHLPEQTWYFRHHGIGMPGVPGNTSGRGDRW